jgi:tetraacyldisaccharide 4'-kinase
VLQNFWYSHDGISRIASGLLWPLSLLFRATVMLRRRAYRKGWLASFRIPVVVIVVGNIVVGGSGKTPLIVGLVQLLRAAGYRPGIVSRGYGAQPGYWPRHVYSDSDARQSGDEPLLLARRCRCPVVIAPDRVLAARTLLDDYDCDIVLSDDGLQHYRLRRTMEIAVIDARRGFGNGFCLPAGPLREPVSRLASVDFIIYNGIHNDICNIADQRHAPGADHIARANTYTMRLRADHAVNLGNSERHRPLTSFSGEQVHAVAAIADPHRFFVMLRQSGIEVVPHAFADHHRFVENDLRFGDEKAVLMTEKDAVKCSRFADDRYWYVPLQTQLEPELERQLLDRLRQLRSGETGDG